MSLTYLYNIKFNIMEGKEVIGRVILEQKR